MLRFRLVQNRQIRVSIIPEGQEISMRGPRLSECVKSRVLLIQQSFQRVEVKLTQHGSHRIIAAIHGNDVDELNARAWLRLIEIPPAC